MGRVGLVQSFMLILGRIGFGHFIVGRVGLCRVKKPGPTSDSGLSVSSTITVGPKAQISLHRLPRNFTRGDMKRGSR